MLTLALAIFRKFSEKMAKSLKDPSMKIALLHIYSPKQSKLGTFVMPTGIGTQEMHC